MRALLIEDDKSSAIMTARMLKKSDFSVEVAEYGEDGLELGKYYDFDVILLDLNLPDTSGLNVLQKLRLSEISTPVLILSGNVETSKKIQGLELGADDYVTKPFDRDELMARIKAVIRRTRGLSHMRVSVGDLTIDLKARTVVQNGKNVLLTNKQFQLIEIFALRKGFTVTKEMIMEHLYDGTTDPDIKIIDVLIFNLRSKLGPPEDAQKYIKTIWGRGYILGDSEMDSDSVSNVA